MTQAPAFMKDVDTSETVAPATLESAKKMAAEYFLKDKEIEELEAKIEIAKKERNDLMMRQIPDLFGQIQIDKVGLPEFDCDVNVVPYFKASISSEWPEEKIDKGFDVLEELDGGDIIRCVVSFEFFKEELEEAKKLQEFVRTNWPLANSHPSKLKRTVPWATLTSFVKDYTLDESTDPLTEEQKEALGATIGKTAKIKPRKTK